MAFAIHKSLRYAAKVFLVLLGLLGLFLLLFVPDIWMSKRRFEVYSIMSDLKSGMSKTEVRIIVENKKSPNLNVRYYKNGNIFAFIPVGLMDYTCLAIAFSKDGHLISARVYGEDGYHDRFKDAPPDIEDKTSHR